MSRSVMKPTLCRAVYSYCLLTMTAMAAPLFGTFSVVAFDSVTDEVGVAVQSRAFNVDAIVPWAQAGVGAMARQARTNRGFEPSGIDLLRQGLASNEVLKNLLDGDSLHTHRQIAAVDARGQAAAYTGEHCSDWAGHIVRRYYACQGNIPAEQAVVMAMDSAMANTDGELAERMLTAPEVGQKAGGDRRGKQSAALLVARPSVGHPEYRTRYVDVRVDDHHSPIIEIRRLYHMWEASSLLQTHAHYARAYDAAGQPELAEMDRGRISQSLSLALSNTTTTADSLNGYAWYCAINDIFLDQALIAAERAVKLEPESTDIIDTLAEAHWRIGDNTKSVEVAERALALSPDDPYLTRPLEKFLSQPRLAK